jgi:transcription elongation factor Elf1
VPVYDMWCPECGNKRLDKYFRNMRDRQVFECQICRAKMQPMVPKRMMINMDSTCEGYDEVLDTYLRGNTHRKEVMKAQDLVERNSTPLGRTDRGKWV